MIKIKTTLLFLIVLLIASSVSSQFLSQGVLRKTADCLVYDIIPGNESLALVSHPVDSFHGYFPGDTVFIYGHLLIHVVAPCPGDASYSLDVQFISSAGAEISLNGVLRHGVEAGCVLIESSDGFALLIDNTGGFQIGDSVNVTGNYDPYCMTICMQGIGCIDNAVVTSLHPPSNDIRGTLVQGSECHYLEESTEIRYVLTDSDGNVLTDFGQYQPGNFIHVVGNAEYDPSVCPSANYTIIVEAISQEGALCVGLRGNANGDISGDVNISDLTFMVDYMFRGGPTPWVMEEADFNGDGNGLTVDIVDIVSFVDYIFRSGSAPVACQ